MNKLTQQPLRYFEQQHCSKQWRLVIASLGDALANLDVALRQQVLHSTGQQMAQSLSLTVQPSLAALNQQLNDFWFDLDWGYVDIGLRQDALYLEHHHCPVSFGRYDSHAYVALSQLLEGFYSYILEQQGGDSSAKVVFMQAGNPMVFGYKDQGQG
ncbi:cellulose biosynthesis protein BcsD [Shewanella sp.]|uniref:cellulose biosynthesis protein BcsD n=1 Tax=Shewanella sp. TaxID=50422 RepID=UPI003A982B89